MSSPSPSAKARLGCLATNGASGPGPAFMPPLSRVRRRSLGSVRVRVHIAGRRVSYRRRTLAGLVYGAGGNLRGTTEAEDHAREDGEGCEALERRDGARAG